MSEERVHELLYSCDSRTELCEMIARLEDENVKLQNQLHDQQDTEEHNFVRNAREYKRVCDENVKLRKLIRIMHGELVSCEECGYVCGGHKFDSYVRELGVEE